MVFFRYAWRRGAWAGAVLAGMVCGAPGQLRAEELVIPFACEMRAGEPRLIHSTPTSFPIVGARETHAFSSCRPGQTSGCETIRAHRFSTVCDGQPVSWAAVAASASALGIRSPVNLPAGYAPIAGLRGRFVLPGFGRTTRMPSVARQFLSPDSVIAEIGDRQHEDALRWVTVVRRSEEVASANAALKVSTVLVPLLLVLFAGGFALARRNRVQPFDARGILEEKADRRSIAVLWSMRRLVERFKDFSVLLLRRVAGSGARQSHDGDAFDHLINSLALAKARIAQTEVLVSSLSAGHALRSVLQSELDGLRKRTDDVARRGRILAPERAGAMVRGLTRDLARIARIAQGASEQIGSGEENHATASAAPATVFEAYRVLGLNAEAPQTAVKKVVDALRMSWHPDHAQSEPDRLFREQRIKQVNAAWDLLKGDAGRSAAA